MRLQARKPRRNETLVALLICLSATHLLVSHTSKVELSGSGTKKNVVDEEYQAACRHEDADGKFVKANGTYWNWQNADPNCSTTDFLSLFSGNMERIRMPRTTFVIIGDSIDRNLFIYFSEAANFTKQPMLWEEVNTTDANTAKWMNMGIHRSRHGEIFTKKTVSLVMFRIFGMYRPCSNGGYDREVDSRWYNRTADRIGKLLPVDVLSRIPKSDKFVVSIGSNLWDVAPGCNDHPNISATYAEEYTQGIKELHHTIHESLPDASIYWRTAGPMARPVLEKKGPGFTRDNQNTLNNILRRTVKEHGLGIVVDWWNQVQGVPERILRGELPDGIHYRKPSSNAFFNLWLNTVFDHEPDFLVETLDPTKTHTSPREVELLETMGGKTRENKEWTAATFLSLLAGLSTCVGAAFFFLRKSPLDARAYRELHIADNSNKRVRRMFQSLFPSIARAASISPR
jgi:hypothetical protein